MNEKKDHRWIYVPEYSCLAYVDPATGAILTRIEFVEATVDEGLAFSDESECDPTECEPEFLDILAQHFDMSTVRSPSW